MSSSEIKGQDNGIFLGETIVLGKSLLQSRRAAGSQKMVLCKRTTNCQFRNSWLKKNFKDCCGFTLVIKKLSNLFISKIDYDIWISDQV